MKKFYVRGLLFLVLTGTSLAQLSPGPLAEPHQHLSGMTKCLSCHTWGSQDLTPKCQDCHTLIDTRIQNGEGYHGQLETVECASCHSDHIGTQFEMIRWEPSREEFNHDQTQYPLENSHLELKCQDCHQPDFVLDDDVREAASKRDGFLERTFLGLGDDCASCHEDVHAGEFKESACDDCHTTIKWSDAIDDFDHESQTRYILEGAHEDLNCYKCHSQLQAPADELKIHKFTGLSFDTCTDCHQDEHKGAFGQDCLECHSMNSFKSGSGSGSFDHATSRFPLLGLHLKVACEACHTKQGQFQRASSFDACSDCHSDYHQGVFADDEGKNTCEQCHSENGFLPAMFGMIEHQDANFELEGSHLATPCFACHGLAPETRYRWDPLSCESCHSDSHGGQFEAYRDFDDLCDVCHTSNSWDDLLFDHQGSDFPLKGAHQSADCQQCHTMVDDVRRYADTPRECVTCHLDPHARQFLDHSCEHCHSNDIWSIADFDHGKKTDFPLDGRHDAVKCGECHKFDRELNTVRFRPVPSDCQDCHQFRGQD